MCGYVYVCVMMGKERGEVEVFTWCLLVICSRACLLTLPSSSTSRLLFLCRTFTSSSCTSFRDAWSSFNCSTHKLKPLHPRHTHKLPLLAHYRQQCDLHTILCQKERRSGGNIQSTHFPPTVIHRSRNYLANLIY